MHVFSMVIVVVMIGSFGVYLAIRSLGGSKTLSLFGALGYCLIPWVELPIFKHGHFGNFGLVVYLLFLLFSSLSGGACFIYLCFSWR